MGQVPFFFVKSDADSRYDNNWRAGQGIEIRRSRELQNCVFVRVFVRT